MYVRKRPLLANLITCVYVCTYACTYVMYRNLKNSTEVLMIVKERVAIMQKNFSNSYLKWLIEW